MTATPFGWLPTTGHTLAEAAVRYAVAGWPVFLLAEYGKAPLGGRGLLDATVDPYEAARLWRLHPRSNIGLRIPHGLVVVDVDGPAGVEALRSSGPLPRTLTARTSRGWHCWFDAPAGVMLRQRAGVLPGVDTRTAGRGYVVAPPSVHATGVVYEWARRVPPAPLPAWLIDLLVVPAAPPRPAYAPPTGFGERLSASRYAASALRGEAAAVAEAIEGTRNHRLYAAWLRCTRDADVAPFLPRHLVRAELTRAALAAGLSEHEIEQTLREAVAA